MNDQANIIALAEFVGWEAHQVPIAGGFRTKWVKPDGTWTYAQPAFYTDANDCDAVIRALRERDIQVIINHHGKGFGVSMRNWKTNELIGNKNTIDGDGDDYKHGVCELALKVRDNDK